MMVATGLCPKHLSIAGSYGAQMLQLKLVHKMLQLMSPHVMQQ
jgi:hypothetical protein